MNLAEGVKKYLQIAGQFGALAPLSRFGLSRDETERTFSAWDEDYQINRYMVLSLERSEQPTGLRKEEVYLINGFEYSHVSFHADIRKLL